MRIRRAGHRSHAGTTTTTATTTTATTGASRGFRSPVALTLAAALTVTLGGGTAAAVSAALSGHGHGHAHAGPTLTLRPLSSAVTSSPTPSPVTVPGSTVEVHVPRPQRLVTPTLLVRSRHALSARQLRALQAMTGVTRSLSVDTGEVAVDGHEARLLGVTPATFRAWTPQRTARSNQLWSSIATGEVTASFDMGHDAKLPLGSDVPVGDGVHLASLRVGAFASVGLGDTDAVVDRAAGRSIGLVPGSGLLLSAPASDALVLAHTAKQILGSSAQVELLRDDTNIRDAGEFIDRSAISTYLDAAASRLGKPYVWGATGPNSFDCSGLVQWSFAKAGVAMPRVAAEQFLTGVHVPYSAARPGDLLFWHYDPTDPTDVDHVAIYAGNGMMLVAPHTGLDVEYVAVPLAHLAGVVRVDPALARDVA